jgi:hypothetical protein
MNDDFKFSVQQILLGGSLPEQLILVTNIGYIHIVNMSRGNNARCKIIKNDEW